MGLLRRLFRFREQTADEGIYLYFRLDRSGEVVRVRINPSAELMLDYNNRDRFIRKQIVGPRSFERAEAEMTFDERFRLVEWEIQGAELVTEEDFLAQERDSGT